MKPVQNIKIFLAREWRILALEQVMLDVIVVLMSIIVTVFVETTGLYGGIKEVGQDILQEGYTMLMWGRQAC